MWVLVVRICLLEFAVTAIEAICYRTRAGHEISLGEEQILRMLLLPRAS